ncbi:hypothetical protein ACS0TY_017573 [Phlomoides rotata]
MPTHLLCLERRPTFIPIFIICASFQQLTPFGKKCWPSAYIAIHRVKLSGWRTMLVLLELEKEVELLWTLRDTRKARGLKKHLKSLNALKHWMLDKLGGAFAPKPSSGPHKSRECLPLILILQNRLKYALTYREVIAILMQRHVLVDGKVRTDKTYPAGFMGDLTDMGLIAIGRGCCRLAKFEIHGCKKIMVKGMRTLASLLRRTLVDRVKAKQEKLDKKRKPISQEEATESQWVYCWDYLTRLVYLLVSLELLRLDTFFNKVLGMMYSKWLWCCTS